VPDVDRRERELQDHGQMCGRQELRQSTTQAATAATAPLAAAYSWACTTTSQPTGTVASTTT